MRRRGEAYGASMKRIASLGLGLSLSLSLGACNCAGIDSDDKARIAYLGLDAAVGRALQLGFDGFNAASSANIPDQADEGSEGGDMAVSGQVDQGASANKGMRLKVSLVEYSDGDVDDPETDDEEKYALMYDTAEGAPLDLNLNLRDIPDGTLAGTLAGVVLMTGDLEGEVELSLTFAGDIEPADGDEVRRKAGTTQVTGTVMSDAGEYLVDVLR